MRNRSNLNPISQSPSNCGILPLPTKARIGLFSFLPSNKLRIVKVYTGTCKKCIKKQRRSNVVEKIRKVSDSVWVCFEAVIIEKTLKEK